MLNGSRRAGAELALAIGGDWWRGAGEESDRQQTGVEFYSGFTEFVFISCHLDC